MRDVAVVVDPADYAAVLAELDAARRRDHAGAAPEARRQGLCPHRRLRRRDLQLVRRRAARSRRPAIAPSAAGSPRRCATARTRTRAAAFYRTPERAPASPPRGRCRARSSPTTTSTTPTPPMNASPSSIRRARRPAPSSSTPIRAASPRATSLVEAYRKALACDPVSAFGGIVALNRPLDAEAARAITEIFTEVIIAPDASEEAIAIVARQEESAPAAGRRPARPARRRASPCKIGRRRLPGAVARQRRRSTTCSSRW